MARGILLARREKNLKEAKQKVVEKVVLSGLDRAYNACATKDVDAAIELLQSPLHIDLLYQHYTSYILFAILSVVASSNVQWSDVLSKMNNPDIKKLQECLDKARRNNKPDFENTRQILIAKVFNLPENQHLDTSEILSRIKKLSPDMALRAKRMFIVMTAGENWNAAVNQMNILSEAIDKFEPQKSEQKTKTQSDKKFLYSYDALAKKFGFQDARVFSIRLSQVLADKTKEEKEKIRGLFLTIKRKNYLPVKHFDELASLFIDHRRTENKTAFSIVMARIRKACRQ